jgi:hypothetical protein
MPLSSELREALARGVRIAFKLLLSWRTNEFTVKIQRRGSQAKDVGRIASRIGADGRTIGNI